MSPPSRRPAPAFITVPVGALWRGDRLQVEMMEVSGEPHQGDHLVTSGLWSEYVAALNSVPTPPPADSLNQRLTLS